jgi:hypothetical protein
VKNPFHLPLLVGGVLRKIAGVVEYKMDAPDLKCAHEHRTPLSTRYVPIYIYASALKCTMCILVCGSTDVKTPCPTRAPNTPSTPLGPPVHAPPCTPPPPRASPSPRRRVPPCPPPPRLPDPLTSPSSDPLTLDPWPHRRCRTLNRLDAPPLNPWRLLWLDRPIL